MADTEKAFSGKRVFTGSRRHDFGKCQEKRRRQGITRYRSDLYRREPRLSASRRKNRGNAWTRRKRKRGRGTKRAADNAIPFPWRWIESREKVLPVLANFRSLVSPIPTHSLPSFVCSFLEKGQLLRQFIVRWSQLPRMHNYAVRRRSLDIFRQQTFGPRRTPLARIAGSMGKIELYGEIVQNACDRSIEMGLVRDFWSIGLLTGSFLQ